jgi:hypothetical protein
MSSELSVKWGFRSNNFRSNDHFDQLFFGKLTQIPKKVLYVILFQFWSQRSVKNVEYEEKKNWTMS